MADEHVPSPSPQPHTTEIQGGPRPPARQTAVASNGHVGPADTARPSRPSELRQLAGWVLGLLLVLVCGWGLLAFAFYLSQTYERDPRVALVVGALFSLALFLLLEHNYWLSRLMGLDHSADSPTWKSAVLFWLLGVPGLLFRPAAAPGPARADTRGQPLPSPASKGRQQETPHTDSTREIVETVVFVVVLVLLLKSFAAEAFVIPTGSMAETLWGYQKVVTCKSCGHKFPVNCSDEVDPSDGIFAHVFACVCPNCLQPLHFDDTPQEVLQTTSYLSQYPGSVAVRDPGWSSGDRVLVAKFLYSMLENDPDRLDVVVFKYPGDESFPRSGPQKNHTPMNYIKRLIGLPGESIAIFRGKLYVLPPDKGIKYDDHDPASPEQRKMLWQRRHMHIDENEAIQRFRQGDRFHILRKDPKNVLAMMRPVYDDNHPPTDLEGKGLPPRWAPAEEGAWSSFPAEHSFRHPSGSGDQTDWLRYRHITRRWQGKPGLITDIMGYNSGFSVIPAADSRRDSPRMKKDRLPGENWASDLILECDVTADKAEGNLTLELSKGIDRFRAVWDLAAQTCTLVRVTPGDNKEELASKPSALKPGSSHRLRFANVDERLTVWVDNSLLFGDGVVYTPPKEGGPQVENDLNRPASIGAKGAGLSVRNLRLFRDTYYTATENSPSSPDVDFKPEDPATWDKLQDDSKMPVMTMYVQPEHYLCLGDNSPESSDGRSWGTVPRRLLLGRALLVYYPFSRAGRIR